jgi:hypothetical protein
MDESLPKLANVILKVKQLQNLTPAEEFVYLIYIEEVPEELAREMIEGRIKGTYSEGNKDNIREIS